MSKIIAFTGTHCTGKTTLKNELYDHFTEMGYSVHKLEFSVGEVSKEIGIHCGEIPSYENRMALQDELLKQWTHEIIDVVNDCDYDFIICDRCPIDFMIYPNLEASSASGVFQKWLYNYNESCINFMECVDYVFLTPIHWKIIADSEERNTRGVMEEGYLMSSDFIARGIFEKAADKSSNVYWRLMYKTIEDRVSEVMSVI